MVFELKQNLKLSQQLIMTPQLQQAIKLLQLSRLELADVINQAIEANPLLEETAPDEEDEWRGEELNKEYSLESAETRENGRTGEVTGEGDGRSEYDWQSYFEDRVTYPYSSEKNSGETPNWDNLISAKPSLTDHVMWQLKLSNLTPEEMLVGEHIIGNLDVDGYLCETVEAIAQVVSKDPLFVEEVLRKIQQFDPRGIAARDLKECLLLQVEAVGIANPLVKDIISEHLKNIENKNYKIIAKRLNVSISEVAQAISIIRGMDPKPGSIYNEERLEAVVPDVYVVKIGDEYKIYLNEDNMPRLQISRYYRDMLGRKRSRQGVDNNKKYIRENLQSASWLIKSLQQRQKTMYRVAESILKFQKDFLDGGINYLKPLVLKDVAEDVEMHESTISRVVTNKYMQTPSGLYELKFFFSSSLNKANGHSIASKSVKEEIRKLIGAENPQKPYKDQEIVQIMQASGITIARRTVAKYREMMGILPTSKRKSPF